MSSAEVEPRFTLGSRSQPGADDKKLVIGSLQANGPTFDKAFTSLRSRVSNAIQTMSSNPTNVVDDSQEVMFRTAGTLFTISLNYIQIIEYRFLKIDYESKVDWCIKTDYLRCNAEFHGNERRDFVFLNHPRIGDKFGRLVLIFTCRVDSYDYPLALVQMLEPGSRNSEVRRVDKSLSIYRYHMQPRNRCEVIPLDWIVRGALFVADPKYAGDYFLIDTVDSDMYLRVMETRRRQGLFC